MADTDPAKPAASRRTPTWVRALLVVSLALNLMVVGIVGGAILGHRGGPPRADLGEAAYGPYARALAEADREALRQAMRSELPRLRANREAVRRGFRDLLGALQAEPYAPERVAEILETQEARVGDQGRIWRGLLVERLSTMTAEERKSFAERLEQVLRRGPPRRGHHPAPPQR